MRGLGLFVVGIGLATAALAQDTPPDLPPGAGPRGTSGETPDDTVGYASLLAYREGAAPVVGIAATHPQLPRDSFIEVTALDSGRTVAMVVIGRSPGRGVVALSPQAADALGIGDGAAVRVRSITPSPFEQATMRAGRATGARLDAPQPLLVALRKRLAGGARAKPVPTIASVPARPQRPVAKPVMAEAPVPRSAPVKSAPPKVAVRGGGYGVQVAALSSAERAAGLARALGGHVVAAPPIYRVQLGPFADNVAAASARDRAVRAGYRDARIFHSE